MYTLNVDDKTAKSLNILAISLNILHNYFDSPKIFSDLYLAKFLDTSAKSLFPCKEVKGLIWILKSIVFEIDIF